MIVLEGQPAFSQFRLARLEAKLQNIKGYASQDYVTGRPLVDGANQFQNQVMTKRWLNVTWIVHPNLPGVGTASCATYLWHRRAIGQAMPLSMKETAQGGLAATGTGKEWKRKLWNAQAEDAPA